ncbi:tail sheath [Erwinia phage Faunus]|uniref:Tail sheath protein n=1 Tax=Erwinia phage Faunus TaxID=2182346 RepID=A0A2U8UWT1_9CAUD|nr:tail sheath [Erwinia phage Faunus]AWN08643.1 hypothetical protein [Erwinia phage Faunus]
MSVPISYLIDVQIAVAPNAVATDGFGPLIFMTKSWVPVVGEVPVRQYASLKEVQEDFPTGEVYNAATAYYSQKPTPKTFLVGSVSATTVPATAPKVEGSTSAVLNDVKAVVAGVFTMNVNGVTINTAPIDFSGAADFQAVTTLLQNAINLVATAPAQQLTVTQVTGKFTVTSNISGSSSIIQLPTGDVATVLKLATGTVTSGTDGTSITTDLNAAAGSGKKFFFVAADRLMRGTGEYFQICAWAEASGRVFGYASTDANILKANTDNPFKRVKDGNYQRTICVYDASTGGVQYPEISILGRAATVNFNVAGSALVLAFKKGPTITTANLSTGQLAALRSYNGNAFIDVDGNTLFLDGKMSDGTWFDTVQGVSWLTQQITNNVFNLFYQSTTKIPWTDTGVAMVNQQVTNALELARTNGLIAPGYDNEGVFYPTGYKVISTDIALLQSQKGQRVWEGTSFIAIGSGAIQGATISGTFVQ